nr:glycosyltransferase family 2 protein [Lentibacter algarum]
MARFAAHHIGLGCSKIYLYLDAPTNGIEALSHPKISIFSGAQTHNAIHRRQMQNANQAYQQGTVDWLAHVDSDEFLLPEKPLQSQLDTIPSSHDWARILPVEALTPMQTALTHCKIAPQFAQQPRRVLETLYPEYGLHLRTGYLSHSEGKPLVRTGLRNARLGIHKLIGGKFSKPCVLEQTKLAHFHATSWEDFSNELPRRLASRSYVSARNDQISIADLINLVQDSEGLGGLRAFYAALRSTSAEHLAALRALNMLLSVDLQLTAKARNMFPEAMKSIST